MQQAVATKIRQVNVYRNCALVQRRGSVQITGQERSLLIPNLPANLRPDSVRVAGRGTGEVIILHVDCRPQPTPAERATPAENHPLAIAIRAAEVAKQKVRDRREALQLQRRFIQRLSEQSVDPFAQSLAEQQASLSKAQQFLQFVEEQYLQICDVLVALDEEEQHIEQQLQTQRQELQSLYTTSTIAHQQVCIDINPIQTGDWLIELTYIVDEVSWQPIYDLRWESSAPRINLSSLAQVQQQTGEDWQQVQLLLSTGEPGIGPMPPPLEPWYIDLPPNPFVQIRYSRERYQAASQALAPEADEEDGPDPDLFPAAPPESAIEAMGAALTYAALGECTIPSDRERHTVTLRNDDLGAHWRYIAMPRLMSRAYVEVTAQNRPLGASLLPGMAALYRDGAFVGNVLIPSVAPNERFTVRFGIDDTVRIERQLSDRRVEKNLIGNRRRIHYTYQLQLQNLATHPSELCLIEQLPMSRSDKLKVQLTKTKPKIEQTEQGYLIWILALGPRSAQEVSYQFAVDYPADLPVSGLDD